VVDGWNVRGYIDANSIWHCQESVYATIDD